MLRIMSFEGYLQFMVSIGFCINAANKERKETGKVEETRVWANTNLHTHSFYMNVHHLPPPHTLTNLPASQIGR